ncbi:hypothetical protein [Desulfovibrio sp. JC022]|uniref:hypothetical protein n=1 Tax=Desulfovibrio sp. JC022 TaxID=2593642 RepID=UPI0013D8C6EC|nr:hypothetical protein [Desulfovibrio sp. JC022]NDV22156.1 hypothetical protein [Desulfovibrio sp. JC022]
MKYESELSFWHRMPDENFLKTVFYPTFNIDCCDCFGTASLEPFFCHTSDAGLAVSKMLSAYQLRIIHGPTCQNYTEGKLKAWTEYMLRSAQSVQATSVSVTPPYYHFMENKELSSLFDNIFDSMGFAKSEKHTVVLDISQGEDSIFKNLKYETRRSVRRVAETAIKVVDLRDKTHVRKWQEIKQRTNTINTQRIKNISSLDLDNYSYFVAVLDDEPLAWAGVKWGKQVGFIEGITTEPSARRDKSKRLANYALQWHIIKEALRRKVKYFDYAGAEPDSGDPKKVNIMKFKLSWGGELVSYTQYNIELDFIRAKTISAIKLCNNYRKDLTEKYHNSKKK